jgi:DNA repair protein RadD
VGAAAGAAYALRSYQLEALRAIDQLILQGVRDILVIAPTGAGKTVIFSHMLAEHARRGEPSLAVAHRKELIDQTSQKLDAIGVDHGVVMAGHERVAPWLPVQVASVQTLARRPSMPAAGLVIVDEAHHARAGTYAKILDHYPNAPVLGATATPWRTDGRGLGELFEDLVVAARPRELIEQGHLVPYTGFAYDSPDMRAVTRKGSDYDAGELGRVMGARKLVGNIVEQWQQHAGGARTVVFAVNVEHSRALAQRFLDAGVAAEHLDGTTDPALREAILRRLTVGATRIVCNVGVLTEGWDCPAVECCILARPTLSLALYLQMVGRGLRTIEGRPEVTTAVILDHAGCALEFGLPQDDQDYSLEAKSKRAKDPSDTETRPVRECPHCYFANPGGATRCEECGFVFPVVAAKPPAAEDGQLVEAREKAARDAAAKAAEKVLEAERDALRGRIQQLAQAADRERRWSAGDANRHLFAVFGKSRTAMNIPELQAVLAYLEDGRFAARHPAPPPPPIVDDEPAPYEPPPPPPVRVVATPPATPAPTPAPMPAPAKPTAARFELPSFLRPRAVPAPVAPAPAREPTDEDLVEIAL